MNNIKNIQRYRSIVILVAFIIVSLILWNTYDFFQKFKQEERAKMEIIAAAQKELITNTDLNASFGLPLKILNSKHQIPLIWVTEKGTIESWQNLDSIKATSKDSVYLKKQLALMKKQNLPIEINLGNHVKQFIYYKDSDLLTKLKYYPLALLLILLLFSTVIYLFFKSNKIAEQNRLWSGMAKETAHQIGTPLTSLLGWVEILRLDNVSKDTVDEIEKDVHRLNTIAERFSKIGSIPKLQKENIVVLTKHSFDYLKARSSKKIQFEFKTFSKEILVNSNAQLYSWVIENLVKNAIDAMNGKGILRISILKEQQYVKICIEDTGKGIPKKIWNQIFTPGFTTKKRGWGLGLSLSKRIIEDYHNGKIFVKSSTLNQGTTICVKLTVSSS